jgi:hypothetical protein
MHVVARCRPRPLTSHHGWCDEDARHPPPGDGSCIARGWQPQFLFGRFITRGCGGRPGGAVRPQFFWALLVYDWAMAAASPSDMAMMDKHDSEDDRNWEKMPAGCTSGL